MRNVVIIDIEFKQTEIAAISTPSNIADASLLGNFFRSTQTSWCPERTPSSLQVASCDEFFSVPLETGMQSMRVRLTRRESRTNRGKEKRARHRDASST